LKRKGMPGAEAIVIPGPFPERSPGEKKKKIKRKRKKAQKRGKLTHATRPFLRNLISGDKKEEMGRKGEKRRERRQPAIPVPSQFSFFFLAGKCIRGEKKKKKKKKKKKRKRPRQALHLYSKKGGSKKTTPPY